MFIATVIAKALVGDRLLEVLCILACESAAVTSYTPPELHLIGWTTAHTRPHDFILFHCNFNPKGIRRGGGRVSGGGGGVLTHMFATPLKTSCVHLHTYLILRCSWTCTWYISYILILMVLRKTQDALRAFACNKWLYRTSKVAIIMKTLD